MKAKILLSSALAALMLLSACGAQQQGASSEVSTGGAVPQSTAMTQEIAPHPNTQLNPQEPVTITLWHYYAGQNQQALEAAVDEFNQTLGIERGVIVQAVSKGSISQLEEEVTNSAMGVINSQEMPDMFSSYPDKAIEIDALGMISDLNEYFTEEERAMYVDSFMQDGASSDGRLLMVPIVKSTELLYLNATEWEEFAQSEGASAENLATWETLYETAKSYYMWTDEQTPDTAWDGTGFVGFDSLANFIIIGSKQLGLDVIDAQIEGASLDEEVLRRIFDIYCGGMSLGYFYAGEGFRSDDIKSGELVSFIGSSSGAAYFPTWIERDNERVDIDFEAFAYPVFEGAQPYAIQQGAGMCVSKSTPQRQEGAALFLKWFTQTAQNIDFAMTTGYLPVQTATYESEDFDASLEQLRQGDVEHSNVAKVYEIALHQILDAQTYAAKAFEGSYDVRFILQNTLIEETQSAQQAADELKAQGLSEEQILDALDMDARFEGWIAQIQTQLSEREIAYS